MSTDESFTYNRANIVNGWLEIEQGSVFTNKKNLIHVKLDNISHLSREGPIPTNQSMLWNINICMIRRSHDNNLIRYSIPISFTNIQEADEFLIKINAHLY